MTSSSAGWRAPVPYSELSERQQEVLQFLWSDPSPYSPSYREIGDAVGLNGPSAVRYQLTELETKGWVRRRLPVLGLVPAGKPNEALQVNDDGWQLPAELVGNGELFLLRVHGTR